MFSSLSFSFYWQSIFCSYYFSLIPFISSLKEGNFQYCLSNATPFMISSAGLCAGLATHGLQQGTLKSKADKCNLGVNHGSNLLFNVISPHYSGPGKELFIFTSAGVYIATLALMPGFRHAISCALDTHNDNNTPPQQIEMTRKPSSSELETVKEVLHQENLTLPNILNFAAACTGVFALACQLGAPTLAPAGYIINAGVVTCINLDRTAAPQNLLELSKFLMFATVVNATGIKFIKPQNFASTLSAFFQLNSCVSIVSQTHNPTDGNRKNSVLSIINEKLRNCFQIK